MNEYIKNSNDKYMKVNSTKPEYKKQETDIDDDEMESQSHRKSSISKDSYHKIMGLTDTFANILENENEVSKRREYLLRNRLDNERKTNKLLIERDMGKQVCLGSIIQLQHIDSNQFITIEKDKSALISNNCSRVMLDDCGINAGLCVHPGLS